MHELKSAAVMAVLALATSHAASAADGIASFRVQAARLMGFEYTATLQAGIVTGQIANGATVAVNLTNQGTTGWTGMMGATSVAATPPLAQADGSQSVAVQTTGSLGGNYNYTMGADASGNLQVQTTTSYGNTLLASLTNLGSLFSIGLPNAGLQVAEYTAAPGSYAGVMQIGYQRANAYLTASGTLDLNTLAQTDRALFVLLYVLPFDMGY